MAGIFHAYDIRGIYPAELDAKTARLIGRAIGRSSVVKKIVYQFGYMFDIEPFSIPLGLNFTTMSFLLFPRHVVYMLLIYLPLSLIALFGFLSITMDFRQRSIQRMQIVHRMELQDSPHMMGV